jgi:IS5 family transposase
MKQLSFLAVEHAQKKKKTKRDLFLAQMEAVVPWGLLLEQIKPHYPKNTGRGPQIT